MIFTKKKVDTTTDYLKISRRDKIKKIVSYFFIYLLLVLGAFTVIFPFYWMIQLSFKSLGEYTMNPLSFFTRKPVITNYITAWTTVNLFRYMINTTIFAVITTAILVFVSILAAFAFARLEFYGKNIVFSIYLATMMIPMELFTITNYATIVNLHLRNTFIGLIFPSVMSVFYIYLLRQNFMQVPDSLYFASKIDNTSDFKYLFKVLVPICKPTIVSIAILKFIECWNSFVWPRLITDKSEYYLISNGIQMLRTSGFGRENIPAMMAAVVCVSLPLLIIFIIFRNQIMSAVSKSGTKG